MTISIIEPKFVDSTNTRPYQPTTTTEIPNLFIAGAHVKRGVELWSMENASLAGRLSADAITGQNTGIEMKRSIVSNLANSGDDILFALGAPNIFIIILGLVMKFLLALLLLIIVVLIGNGKYSWAVLVVGLIIMALFLFIIL